jgi:serine/threonine-protein kinase
MVSTPVAPGALVADRYLVECQIGRGGMSNVYAAVHLVLGQRVALKVLAPRHLADERLRARFLREAQAAVRLRGEHVARILDVGSLPGGAPYMVLEHLEGEDLAAFLTRAQRLPVGLAVDFVLQACLALAEAHGLGIVHRDLKPANLFLCRATDGALQVKVLDFGVSKMPAVLTTTDLTLGSVLGTPQYMAPEQMQASRDVDARADVWSLGVILYELLTGACPFERPSLVQVCTAVTQGTVPSARALRPSLPAGLAAVLERCLQRQPRRRYGSVRALAEALAPFGGPRAEGYVAAVRNIERRCASLSSVPAAARSVPPSSRRASPPPPDVAAPGTVSWASGPVLRALGGPGAMVLVGACVGMALALAVTTWAARGPAATPAPTLHCP